jgi:hypothetical protein
MRRPGVPMILFIDNNEIAMKQEKYKHGQNAQYIQQKKQVMHGNAETNKQINKTKARQKNNKHTCQADEIMLQIVFPSQHQK